jgi:hypothetical protein
MRIPFRRRSPGPLRSTLESLETRQLLSTTATSAVDAVQPPVSSVGQISAAAQPASAAPRVAFVQFEPLTGRVLVSIDGGLAGINTAELTNPANYSFTPVQLQGKPPRNNPSRPGAGVVLVPNYVVTGVSLAPNIPPTQPQSLIVVINNNQPLRPGFYQFTIHSAGIVDNAGVALDGAYLGVFPSGDGQPGSDFVADLAVVKNTVQPALPVVPPPPGPPAQPNGVQPTPIFFPTTTAVHVKVVGNNNRTSRTLGGGNAVVVALAKQHFPGTFHLPGTAGGPVVKASDRSRTHRG